MKEICKYLKDGFGLIMSYYGYTNGSVVKIELKNGAYHHIEDKQDSEDIADALFKQNYYQRMFVTRFVESRLTQQ